MGKDSVPAYLRRCVKHLSVFENEYQSALPKPTGEDLMSGDVQRPSASSGGEAVSPSHPPKPAGEWTAEYVHNIIGAPIHYCMTLADAHKAAIAAEREEHARALLAKQTRIEVFQQQLAAEREKVYETLPRKDHPTGTTWKQVAEWNGLACEENQKLLAAEREKVQTLVEAMIKIANDPHCDRCQVAVNALAKVNK